MSILLAPFASGWQEAVLRLRSPQRPSLLVNGLVEGCALPPFRQKKGERTGHGTSMGGPAWVHSGCNFNVLAMLLRMTSSVGRRREETR